MAETALKVLLIGGAIVGSAATISIAISIAKENQASDSAGLLHALMVPNAD